MLRVQKPGELITMCSLLSHESVTRWCDFVTKCQRKPCFQNANKSRDDCGHALIAGSHKRHQCSLQYGLGVTALIRSSIRILHCQCAQCLRPHCRTISYFTYELRGQVQIERGYQGEAMLASAMTGYKVTTKPSGFCSTIGMMCTR